MQSESSEGAGRGRRRVQEAEAGALEEQLRRFERLFEEQPSLQASEDEDYFLVSVRFIKSWRDFCLSQEQERDLPAVMNEDLLQPNSEKLREGLVEKEDFEVVTEDVWNSFGEFRAHELRRGVVTLGVERRVPIYLNEYRYLRITAKQVKDISYLARNKKDYFALQTIQCSENATVQQLTRAIIRKEELEISHEGRLWRVGPDETVQTFLDHVNRAAAKLYSHISIRIKGFGKKLKEDMKMEEAAGEPSAPSEPSEAEGETGEAEAKKGEAKQGWFVVQLREKLGRWFLEAEGDKQCESCYDFTELRFPCKCNNVSYCSEHCRTKDKHFHMRRCEYAEMEEFNRTFRMEIGEGSRRGRVGLRNLGNTCFMNSCLQCLSNTLPLTEYFLARLFEPEINRSNPLGTKGKLARNYAMFIKAMWCEREGVHSPDLIKSAVSGINPMFSGYAQHDSQEFFSFIIDGIHEDLNRIEKKPYVPSIESNGRTDQEVATDSWLAHIRRNQSVITDLMTGQYKSKVTCPTCSKESITFDPFITVTLPISERATNNFECFVFRRDFEEKTKKISFNYGKASLVEWRRSIAKVTGVQEEALQIYLVTIYEGIYQAGRDSLSEIVYKMENENKNVFAFELTEEEMRMSNRIDLTFRLSKRAYYHSSEFENMWFKFPLFFERDTTNGLAIYRRLLRFLYPTTYLKRTNEGYPAYEELMLQKRPFKLVLKYGRKVDRHYSRLEYRYSSELEITDDATLDDLWQHIKDNESEIDVRFNEAGLGFFDPKSLKDYEQIGGRGGRGRTYEDSVGTVELKDCFYNLSEEEELERGNEWYCPSCKQHKQAKKVIQIYKAPKILILHLKRFKNKGSYRKEKNETRVHFPEALDMTPFLIDHTPLASYAPTAAAQGILIPPKHNRPYSVPCSQQPLYDLYAVSNHYGGLGGGHYTAYAKNGEQWLDFNDSSVREISRESIQGSSAYILFYKRRDE